MRWLNEPPQWHADGDRLRVTTGDRTDFWRVTHYGFTRDDGHFYFQEREGDSSVQVGVRGEYTTLYDQAGLMIRTDENHWIKAGVEVENGRPHLSVVVTRNVSDWSLIPLAGGAECVDLRLVRRGTAVHIYYRESGPTWTLARLAPFPDCPRAAFGVMCCSPQRAGFRAEFEGLAIGHADQ